MPEPSAPLVACPAQLASSVSQASAPLVACPAQLASSVSQASEPLVACPASIPEASVSLVLCPAQLADSMPQPIASLVACPAPGASIPLASEQLAVHADLVSDNVPHAAMPSTPERRNLMDDFDGATSVSLTIRSSPRSPIACCTDLPSPLCLGPPASLSEPVGSQELPRMPEQGEDSVSGEDGSDGEDFLLEAMQKFLNRMNEEDAAAAEEPAHVTDCDASRPPGRGGWWPCR